MNIQATDDNAETRLRAFLEANSPLSFLYECETLDDESTVSIGRGTNDETGRSVIILTHLNPGSTLRGQAWAFTKDAYAIRHAALQERIK